MKNKIDFRKAGILLIAISLCVSIGGVSAENDYETFVHPSSTVNTPGSVISSNDLEAYSLGRGLIWDNGLPDEVQGLCNQRGGTVGLCDVVDDIHTTEDFTITGIEWDTVDSSYNWNNLCDFEIYQYTPSAPGAPLYLFYDVPCTRVNMGTLFALPWYRYTMDLVSVGMAFDLPAGDYFIQVRPITDDPTGQNYWLTAAGHPGSQSAVYFRSAYFGYPDWITSMSAWGVDHDVSFRLFGVPVPAELEISQVAGGFGASAVIKNIGPVPAENMMWEMKFEGGIILSGGIASGGPITIPPGGEESISISPFGFGGLILPLNLMISASADNAVNVSTTTPAKLLLIFVDI
jgi:hypothetical protein